MYHFTTLEYTPGLSQVRLYLDLQHLCEHLCWDVQVVIVILRTKPINVDASIGHCLCFG